MLKNIVIKEVKENYNLEINVKRYGEAIDEVGLWESEKIIFNRYIKPSDKILDLGCGWGTCTLQLAYNHSEDNILGLEVRKLPVDWINEVVKGYHATVFAYG